jgi:uncharacterized membrane protein YkoI
MDMKTTRLVIAALCGSACILSVNAEKVRFEELPVPLKDKIRAHSGAAPIEDVDRQTKAGKTIYEVAFKKNGQHTEMIFDDKGEVVTSSGQPALDSRKITFNELPEAVRKTLEARVTSGEVNDIDRQVKNGEANYEIGYKKNGRQEELVISQDGRVLNDAPSVAVGAAAGTATATATSGANTLMAQPVTLSASQKVQMNQVPAEVQRAITTAAAGARIEDIERGTWRGQNVYQAAFKDNGKNVELQVRENGTVLHDPRAVGRTAGRPAEYATLTSLVPLSASTKVERTALPVIVQRRLTTQVGNRQIEDIERGTWQGKTIYQVAFKDANNQHVELQLDEHGNVVFDPRAKR